MVFGRVAGHRRRCCFCDCWHPRSRSDEEAPHRAILSGQTHNRPTPQAHRRPQPRLPVDGPRSTRQVSAEHASSCTPIGARGDGRRRRPQARAHMHSHTILAHMHVHDTHTTRTQYTHKHMCTRTTHTHMHTRTRTRRRARTWTQRDARTYARTHTQPRTRTRTCTRTHNRDTRTHTKVPGTRGVLLGCSYSRGAHRVLPGYARGAPQVPLHRDRPGLPGWVRPRPVPAATPLATAGAPRVPLGYASSPRASRRAAQSVRGRRRGAVRAA